MTDLLNDSPTAVQLRESILRELRDDESVLFVAEGKVLEPLGGFSTSKVYLGAILVTNHRLMVAERKLMRKAKLTSLRWADVADSGRDDDEVIIQKSPSSSFGYPIWKVRLDRKPTTDERSGRPEWKVDYKGLDLLALSIREARAAVEASRVEESRSAYEELRRRRQS